MSSMDFEWFKWNTKTNKKKCSIAFTRAKSRVPIKKNPLIRLNWRKKYSSESDFNSKWKKKKMSIFRYWVSHKLPQIITQPFLHLYCEGCYYLRLLMGRPLGRHKIGFYIILSLNMLILVDILFQDENIFSVSDLDPAGQKSTDPILVPHLYLERKHSCSHWSRFCNRCILYFIYIYFILTRRTLCDLWLVYSKLHQLFVLCTKKIKSAYFFAGICVL